MSVGVGRGRGRLPQQPNGDTEQLRRPNIITAGRGRTIASNPGTSSKFSGIESILSDPDVSSVKLFTALNDFLQASPTVEDIDVLVKKVFEKGLRTQINLDVFCQCFYLASKHAINGASLHMSFFSELERRFKGVDSIKDLMGSSCLWRFYLLFSSVCHFIRNQECPPMKDLIDGLSKLCLNMAQPTDANEARTAALCVARCCHYMKLCEQTNDTEVLMNKLRSFIHGCSSNKECVTWLCLGLEASCLASTSSQISASAMQFYRCILGPGTAAFSILTPPSLNLPTSFQSNYEFNNTAYKLKFV